MLIIDLGKDEFVSVGEMLIKVEKKPLGIGARIVIHGPREIKILREKYFSEEQRDFANLHRYSGRKKDKRKPQPLGWDVPDS